MPRPILRRGLTREQLAAEIGRGQTLFLLKIRKAFAQGMCYTICVKVTGKHWSVDETGLKKAPERYAIWRLEQRINFGLGEPKINKEELTKYWDKIEIDPSKRRVLALALE